MCLENRRVMWCDDSSCIGKTRYAMMFSSGRNWSFFFFVVLDVAVKQPLASGRPHKDGGHEARVPVAREHTQLALARMARSGYEGKKRQRLTGQSPFLST